MSIPELTKVQSDFADRNPASRKYYEQARKYLPGGHTRTVLTHAPFPLVFVAGEGSVLTDADGHSYIDMLGDYTAGLLGHSERRVLDAVNTAMRNNFSVGGIHPAEARLAELMCHRFRLDRVRFTNSGTEANLMAITTAMQATGRRRILVFRGGYHGGILYFASGPAPWNAPYDFVIAPYNDIVGSVKIIHENAGSLAAMIIEPMLGSGGCIPASAEFAREVVTASKNVGAVVIADEVMTSRHGAHGMLDLLGAKADITTFGKYIGGGFSFGAFGGRAELLDQFDTSPEVSRERVISHAGTFNNNISSMTSGGVVLGEVFTEEIAIAHTARGEDFRKSVEAVLSRHKLDVVVSGYGSMMCLHALSQVPNAPDDVAKRDSVLQDLLFFGLIERGVYIAARGMVNLSLSLTDDQLAKVLDALDDTLTSLES